MSAETETCGRCGFPSNADGDCNGCDEPGHTCIACDEEWCERCWDGEAHAESCPPGTRVHMVATAIQELSTRPPTSADIQGALDELAYAESELAAVGAKRRVFGALGRAREHLRRALGAVQVERETIPTAAERAPMLHLTSGSGFSEWVEAKHTCVWCGQPMLVRLSDRKQRCLNDCASGLGACPEHLLPESARSVDPLDAHATGTINSRDPDVASVAAALADARHAKGLSQSYFRKADDTLKRLANRLVAACHDREEAKHFVGEYRDIVEARDRQLASERAAREKAEAERDEARNNAAEASRAYDSPVTSDFIDGVRTEAAHQVSRWGTDHDAGKSPLDWFWLLGYLAQKAADAAMRGDLSKALHHTISTAAALLNWHRALSGDGNAMRPGIMPPAGVEGEQA